MVTTPETYPVWRTRKPVVVVLNRHAATKKSVQHHYYRYLVVSPGAAQNLEEDGAEYDRGVLLHSFCRAEDREEFRSAVIVLSDANLATGQQLFDRPDVSRNTATASGSTSARCRWEPYLTIGIQRPAFRSASSPGSQAAWG